MGRRTGGMSASGPRFAVMLLGAAAALACAQVGAAPSSSSSNKSITYRWVDDQGVVHYGDQVPPQYAQKEHTELNAQGVELKRLDAQRSAEQQAADARKQEATIRQK